jgi:hypothetical protein
LRSLGGKAETLDPLPQVTASLSLRTPYAKRPHRAGEVEAAPAAASEGDIAEWGGLDEPSGSASQLSALPLLM